MVRPVLHALLAVCVLTSSCSLLAADHTREDRAVGTLENVTETLAATETYRFESHMSVTAAGDDRTERVDVEVTGAVDAASRKMHQTATRDGESRRAFVLNRTAYRECAPPWDGWAVDEPEENDRWLNRTPAVRQLSLLKSGSLYWNGTETADGDRAFLVTGEPSADALKEYRADKSQPLFGGPSVSDIELRAWVDADTDRLLRTELRFTVSEGDRSATAIMRTTFSDYGEPVSVELPAEARTNQHELGCPGE